VPANAALKFDHHANYFSFKSLRCVPPVCARAIEKYEQGGSAGNGIIRCDVNDYHECTFYDHLRSTRFGRSNENCTIVTLVNGGRCQSTVSLAPGTYGSTVLDCSRTADSDSFNQFVAMSTPVRDALTVTVPFQNSYPVTNDPRLSRFLSH
jgi:hypothetical protein